METIRSLSESEVRGAIRTLTQDTTPTLATDSKGSSVTSYGLQPIFYLKRVIDGAKSQHFFANFVDTVNLPKGTHQLAIPKRKKYLGRDTNGEGMQIGTSEPDTSDMTITNIDNMDSVQTTPTPRYSGVAISNYNLRVNAVNLLTWAKDDLTYAIGDHLDREIAVTIGNATQPSDTVQGAQTLFGGDATGDTSLANGDVMTTNLVAKAARYLKQKQMYWMSSTVETLSSAEKNPWMPTNDEPFVLFIGPAQEEAFRKDSQFVNAAEYGSDKVVRNGEIGEYLGIKIITTVNVESVAASGVSPDIAQIAGSATTGAAMTRCILMKSKRAAVLAWGQQPTLKVFDYPQRDQTWITLICAYSVVVVHGDAIVFIDVADA